MPRTKKHLLGYVYIARHYKWALDQVFINMNFTSAIIVEGLAPHSLSVISACFCTIILFIYPCCMYCLGGFMLRRCLRHVKQTLMLEIFESLND